MNMNMQYTLMALFIGLIALEWTWSNYAGKEAYNTRETLSNLFIMLGNQVLKPLTIVWGYILFEWIYPFRIFDLPVNGWTFAGAMMVGDFLYYWHHRLSHELTALWALHHVHHSSPWMNFSTAFRINWLGKLINPVFFLPAILLGFSPELVVAGMILNLAYQFFLHTESVGRVKVLEGWINTPSAHRVHHGSNEVYLDKNYGGILMIWDRLFGTYQPETEKVAYGVTTGFLGHNPLTVLFRPVWQMLRGTFKREQKQLDKPDTPPASRRPIRIILGALLAIGLLMLSVKQSRAQTLADLSPEQRADSLTRFMEVELGLTGQQAMEIHELNLAYARRIQAEVLDTDSNAFSKIWKGQSINKEKEKVLKSMLTKEQFQLFRKLSADMRDEMMPELRKALSN